MTFANEPIQLDHAQFVALCAICELKYVFTNLLPGKLPDPDQEALGSLHAAGFLTGPIPDYLRSISTLKPALIGGVARIDSLMHTVFVSNDNSGLLVIGNPQIGYTLHLKATIPNFVGELLGPLNPFACAPPAALDLDLSLDGLQSFAACVDHLRMLFAASLLQRRALPGIAITRKGITHQIEEGNKGSDYRWMVTLLSKAAGIKLAKTAAMRGIEELVSHNLLMPVSENKGNSEWVFLPDMIDIGFRLAVAGPGLVLNRNVRNTRTSRHVINSLFVIGGWSMTHMTMQGKGNQRKFSIRELDGLQSNFEVLAFIEDCCAEKTPKKTASVSSSEQDEPIPEKETASGSGDFVTCPSCYSVVAPGFDTCPRCKSAISGQDNFPNEPKTCTACGEDLKPGRAFCSSCGEKAA